MGKKKQSKKRVKIDPFLGECRLCGAQFTSEKNLHRHIEQHNLKASFRGGVIKIIQRKTLRNRKSGKFLKQW